MQALLRFHNKNDVTVAGNPYGDTSRPWGESGEHLFNLCAEREDRIGNPNPATGRALTVHHHGMASLAPFDGWAEDVHCYGEYKDYVLPGARASTFWYHDHGLATTSESCYGGLEGMHIVRPCEEPYNMARIPQYAVHFYDATFDADCQLKYDKRDAHHDNLFGDTNTVNGAPSLISADRCGWVLFPFLHACVALLVLVRYCDLSVCLRLDTCFPHAIYC